MASAARRIAPAIPISKYANVATYQPSAPVVAAPTVERERETRIAGKIDQAAGVLDRLDANEAECKAAIKEIQQVLGIIARRRQRIEDRILAEMHAAGFDKCHGGRREFALRLAPAALDVLDESLIPEDYIRETITRAVDKAAIKKALAAGVEFEGVRLTQKVSLCRK